MIKDEVRYKALKTKLALLNEEKNNVRLEISGLNKKSTEIFNKIKEISVEIESLKEKNIIVSEHAILRYLEGSGIIDRQGLIGNILSEKIVTAIRTLGDGKYPLNDGSSLSLLVKGNVITTVVKYKGKE